MAQGWPWVRLANRITEEFPDHAIDCVIRFPIVVRIAALELARELGVSYRGDS